MNKPGPGEKKESIVRDYMKGDFDQVASLWVETGMGHPARGDDEKTILGSVELGGRLLVMVEKATSVICGTSWMTFDGRRIHLHHFGILPGYQGKGLADMLLDESLKFVRKKGSQVKLEVHSTNIKAINLYKKHGFDYLGDYDVYIIRDLSKIKWETESGE
jgi:ribosomal protein S18 acetylase RimI-like enzyme